MRKICVIGLGYIGLPTAAMFAMHGFSVIGVDIKEEVVDALNDGHVSINEPNLETMITSAVKSGAFIAKRSPQPADVYIIAVPTPITTAKRANMSYVIAAAESIVPIITKGNMVILESTSPPGTVKDLLVPILKKSGLAIGTDLYVAYSPERVLPGRILTELVENNRIIGGINRESAMKARDLYMTFVRGEILLTDTTTAEMCKIVENTYRDINIAFANELAMICKRNKINVWELIDLCNRHPRVGIHQPGPGVGGHCLAVDPWFLVERDPDLARLIRLSRETNDRMPHYVADDIMRLSGEKNRIKTITVFGATYKPNIDDVRESPIMTLIRILEGQGFSITLYDPYLKEHHCLVKDLYESVKNSDLLLLGVHHRVFKDLDFQRIKAAMRKPNIYDTRNFWDHAQLRRLGFACHVLGDGISGAWPIAEAATTKEE